MMIEFLDADIAIGAVLGAWRTPDITSICFYHDQRGGGKRAMKYRYTDENYDSQRQKIKMTGQKYFKIINL